MGAGGVLLFTLAVATQAGQTGKSTENAAPNGLVVVITSKPESQSLDLGPVSNSHMSGVDLQIHWNEIEPVEGQLNWSKVDALFDAAQSAHRWVQLSIYPGFFTPDWALEGVKTDVFTIQYGPYMGRAQRLPMPWDALYLNHWFAFLKKVSERYGKLPAFKMIAADGPTSVSPEFTLPNAPAEFRQWQNDGYRPSKYVGAWRQVFQFYAAEFPNQYISLSVGGGLSINEQGKIDPGEHQRTKQAVVEQGIALVGRRFALELDDVHAGQGARQPNSQLEDQFVIGYNGRVITGFQMKTSAKYASKGMGAEGEPPLALRKSIDFAMERNSAGQHVNYLEFYAPDVLADEMQADLEYAASLFAQ